MTSYVENFAYQQKYDGIIAIIAKVY